MSSDHLKLTDVVKEYEATTTGVTVSVLKEISLAVDSGDSVSIVGPSGSGKSTLLNIIGTLDRPSSGHVTVDGEDLSRFDDDGLARFRNRKIGFIFQAHHLLPQCTVLENVVVPTLASNDPEVRNGAESRAKELLKRVDLEGRLEHRPGQISGGERQRVAVVRALINRPSLLLADEPTGALDRASAENLAQLLVDLNREQHVTLIVVTHALGLARRLNRQFELRDGVLHSMTGEEPSIPE